VSTRFQYWVPRFHDPPLLFNLDDDLGLCLSLCLSMRLSHDVAPLPLSPSRTHGVCPSLLDILSLCLSHAAARLAESSSDRWPWAWTCRTGETTPLDPLAYADVLADIAAAVQTHEAGLVVAPNAAGGDPVYCLCCDPDSQQRYPQYPPCTCNPENW
jgi:hypothetical protein